MANKRQPNFFTDLYRKYGKGSNNKKYYYFMWRNKLSNSETDFSNLTEEEFQDKYLRCIRDGKELVGDKSLGSLKIWESTDEYQELMQELYAFKMNKDFYELYETYLEKAKQGDDKALNSLKLIKKELEGLNKANRIKKKPDEEGTGFDLS